MMMMMMFAFQNYNKRSLGFNKTTPGGRAKTTSIYYIQIYSTGHKHMKHKTYIKEICTFLELDSLYGCPLELSHRLRINQAAALLIQLRVAARNKLVKYPVHYA
jgi:hypothetical protein